MAIDPYAPPAGSSAADAGPHYVGRAFAASREGDDLAIERDAGLPDACVDCGAATISARRARLFQAMPVWARAIAFVPVLAAAALLARIGDEEGSLVAAAVMIVSVVTLYAKRKRAKLVLPNCAPCDARHVKRLRVAGVATILLIVGCVAPIRFGDGPERGLLYVAAVGVFALVTTLLRRGAIRAVRIDDRTIVLRCIHPGAAEAILQASRGAAPAPPRA